MPAVVTFRADTCDKCKNRDALDGGCKAACAPAPRASAVSFRTEPEAAWKTVVLNRWRWLCPGCFDIEAEKAGRPLQLR